MGVLITLRRTAFIVCLVGAIAWPSLSKAQQTLEPDVKATFLYNFTRFVEWPLGGGPAPSPFRLCVVADAVMEGAIKRAVEGESVNGQPLVMVQPQTAQDAQACQILFVGKSEEARAAHLLAAVRDLPVLTVGDSSRFVQQGGAIQFVLVDNRVRFDINLSSADRAKLKLSSKLLQVARSVEPAR